MSRRMSWRLLACLMFLPSLVAYPAMAEDGQNGDEHKGVQIGRGVICDTQEEVKRYVTLFDGDSDAALGAVNREAQKADACIVAAIVFIPGSENTSENVTDAMARNEKEGAFRIVPILVTGVVKPHGIEQVPPFPQFTLVKVEEFEI